MAVALVLAAAGAPPAAAASGPSPGQVRRAVSRATHSSALWATVNICNSHRHPDVIGIRGQMPALGFPARLQMTIHLLYWDASSHRFLRLGGPGQPVTLGSATYGTVQGGAEFSFDPPVTLSASVTFQWLRRGRLLGQATRASTRRRHGVSDSDPRGYSAAVCRMRAAS